MSGVQPPAGWYADPRRPGEWCWWDGYGWRPELSGTSGFPPGVPVGLPARLDPLVAMQRERRLVPWARAAVWVSPMVQVLALVVFALMVHVMVQDFGHVVLRVLHHRPGPHGTYGLPDLSGSASRMFFYAGLASDLLGLVMLAVLVVLIMWSHAAAEHARNLGYPARLSPVWAVAGWLVPVVSIWFPYWVIRDCLPPGEGARHPVLGWWILYVLGGVGAGMVGAIAGLMWPLGMVLVMVALPPAVIEGVLGARVVAGVAECHEVATAAITGGGRP